MYSAQHNGIGALLTTGVGVSAFAGWLYVCYPGTASALADDSRQSWSFLILVGFVVVAVIGVSIASSVLQQVMALLRSLIQLSVILALIGGAIVLCRREQPVTSPPPSLTHYPSNSPIIVPTEPPSPEPPPPVERNDKWWEQKK